MESRTFELGFARFIEKFHEQIKEDFLADACGKRGLLLCVDTGRQMLEELADGICTEFTRNIDRNTAVDTIADRYIQLGVQCCQQGISMSQMVHAFILVKRHVWIFFQESNFAGQPFDVRSIIALNNRTALFFDRAIYFFLVGYEQSTGKKPSDADRLYDAFLTKLRRDLGLK